MGGSSGGGGGPDTFTSDDVVEMTLGVSEGPIAGLVDGGKTFYLGETPLVSQAGDLNFNKFEIHNYHGGSPATPVKNALGGISSNLSVGVSLANNIPVTRVTPSTSRGLVDSLDVRILFNQVAFYDNKGRVHAIPLDIDIRYRQVGSSTWLPFFGDGRWIRDLKITSPSVREFTKQVPRIEGDWEVKVMLFYSDEGEDSPEVDVAWESLQMTTAEDRAYDNLAVVRILSEASDQLNSIPSLSADWNGLIVKIPSNYDPVTRYYSGTWDGSFKDGFTDNPAWCLYDLLTNETYGAKAYFPELLVDRFSFYEAAQWCDELVPRVGSTGYQPRFTYNDVIDEERDGHSMLHYIASIFGGQLTEDPSGMVVLKVDRPGTIKQIFGPESVENGDFSYNYTDVETRPNTYDVVYTAPELGWVNDNRRVDIPYFVERYGRTAKEHIAVGCLDVYEAQRRAYLRLLKANTETLTVTFKIPRQGLMLEVYDLIGLSDPTMQWGLSGRIKSVDGNTIHLRDALLVPANQSLEMVLQTPNGAQELTVRSSTANTKELTVTSGSLPSDLPNFAQFTLSHDTLGMVKPFRVLSIDEEGSDGEFFVISALEFNPNKFADAENLEFSGTDGYTSDFATLGPPTNLVAQSGTAHLIQHPDGSIESRIYLTWEQRVPGAAQVFYRRVGVDADQIIQAVGSTAYIPNVVDGEEYALKVVLENGIASEELRHVVVGKTELPAKVFGWKATREINAVHLSGPVFPEVDFSFFRIYVGAHLSFFEDAELLTETPTPSFIHVLQNGEPDKYYWISAVDTSGNEGPPSEPITSAPRGVGIADFVEGLLDEFAEAFSQADVALEDLEKGAIFELLQEVRINDAILAAQNVIDGGRAVVERESFELNEAAIINEQTVRADEDAALSATFTGLLASYGDDVDAAFVQERQARADAVSAVASDVTALTTRVGDAEGDITNLQTTKVTSAQAVAAVEQKISSRYGSMSAMASATAFAKATADKISAGYVWRLNGQNLLELVSVQDGVDSGPTSTFKIRADYVEIPGNLKAGNTTAGVIVNTQHADNAVYVYQNSTSTYALYATNNTFSGGTCQMESLGGFTAQFINKTNGSGAYGAFCALDAQHVSAGGGKAQIAVASSGGGYAFQAIAGGYYDSSGGGYLPFTGAHEGMISNTESFEIGDIVVDGQVVAKSLSDVFTEFVVSTQANMPNVVGVLTWVSPHWYIPASFRVQQPDDPDFEPTPETPAPPLVTRRNIEDYQDDYDMARINAVGEGCINVCGRGGDILPGDLIVTSTMRGKGQKQADDLVRSCTVAKAREAVVFSHPDEIKQIACIYMCG